MATNLALPRLRNTSLNGSSFKLELDPDIKAHLKELNEILGKKAFEADDDFYQIELDKAREQAEKLKEEAAEMERRSQEAQDIAERVEARARQAGQKKKEGAQAAGPDNEKQENAANGGAFEERQNANKIAAEFEAKKEEADKAFDLFKLLRFGNRQQHFDLEDALVKPLVAKKTSVPNWDPDGFPAHILDNKDDDKLSIGDIIDKVNMLSNLKHAFQEHIAANSGLLNKNQKVILTDKDYANIADYLIAYGYFVKGITEVNALFNFVQNHKFGAKAVVDFAVISAARTIIDRASLNIEDDDDGNTYNDDAHALIQAIVSKKLPFQKGEFGLAVEKIIKNTIADGREIEILQTGLTNLGITEDELDPKYYPSIISLLKKQPEIDKNNINFFLPGFIQRVNGKGLQAEEVPDVDPADSDFDVVFLDDEKTTITTNTSNVRCAAQLYSALIMDLDLDIFNLTNYLTNNYLIRNRVDITDRKLSNDLKDFVFSNRFTDPSSRERTDRTDAGERQHFYRQVFNIGNGPVPQGVIVNQKFPKLWSKLIPAVKEYIENVSTSLSEDNFVSKGAVLQTVSSIRTSLSQFCTSMSKIISPIINAEWNFIIANILGHPEIIKTVSPTIGSWKGVAEILYAEMYQRPIDATLVYEKARLSHKILRQISDLSQTQLEETNNFIDFCSDVIQLDDTIQSMAADAFEQQVDEGDIAAAEAEAAAYGPNNGIPKMAPQNGGAGEWDF